MERLSAMIPRGVRDPDVHRGARRKSQRWVLHADVEILEPLADSGMAINVSAGGMRIAIDRRVPVGSHCTLRVSTCADRECIEHARVVWVREAPDGWIIGLAFVETQ